MRKVSYWAKHNILKARLLIILSGTLLFILAVLLGCLLLQSDVYISPATVMIPMCIIGIALLMNRYVKVQKQKSQYGYWYKRLSYFLVGLAMFLFTSFYVGSEKLLTWNTYSTLSGSGASLLLKPAPTGVERFSAKQMERANRLLKKMQKHSNLKGLYIFLTVLGGLLLLYLVAILACSIACSGNDALSILVFALGTAGIVWLCVWLIRRISKGKPEKKAETALVADEKV